MYGPRSGPRYVGPVDKSVVMTLLEYAHPIRGLALRYLLTSHLIEGGPRTVRELVDAVLADGFELNGRPSKEVSDALRWEMRRGRVSRRGRGLYGPGTMPRQTAAHICNQVRQLRKAVHLHEPS